MQEQISMTRQNSLDLVDSHAKEGLNIQQMYQHLSRYHDMKMDFPVFANELMMINNSLVYNPRHTRNNFAPVGYEVAPNQYMEKQIARKLDIPVSYMNKMKLDIPSLWDDNVNAWLTHKADKKYIVRSFRKDDEDYGGGRAFLSGSYKMFDNILILQEIAQVITDYAKSEGLRVTPVDCAITENSMHLRFVSDVHEIRTLKALTDYRNPETGDDGGGGVVTGIIIKNSEVGSGKFMIAPRVVVNACSNGYIWQKEGFSRYHVGAKLDSSNDLIQWSNETYQLNKDLIVSQARDVVRKVFSPDWLGKSVDQIEEAAKYEVKHMTDCMKNFAEKIGFNHESTNNCLNWLMRQGSARTGFDIVQAATYEAQKLDSDRRFEVEVACVENMNSIMSFDRIIEN